MTKKGLFGQTQAYSQLYYMLEHGDFKQRSMARDLDVPHGSRISGFVNWLVDLKFVEKVKNRKHKIFVYRVTSPVSLIKFYANFRNMNNVMVSKDWGTDRNKMMEYFKSEGGVFCLTTALEQYTEYVRDPAINVYVDKSFFEKMRNEEKSGTVRINMYEFSPGRTDNITEKNGLKITTRLRTLIDLYCSDKAYAGEPLVKQLWS